MAAGTKGALSAACAQEVGAHEWDAHIHAHMCSRARRALLEARVVLHCCAGCTHAHNSQALCGLHSCTELMMSA